MGGFSWTDKDILEALDAYERLGLSAAKIGKTMNVSRSSVLGVMFRVNQDADRVPCKCRKTANRDGGMPARWWSRTA